LLSPLEAQPKGQPECCYGDRSARPGKDDPGRIYRPEHYRRNGHNYEVHERHGDRRKERADQFPAYSHIAIAWTARSVGDGIHWQLSCSAALGQRRSRRQSFF
jgi:hypothetical protein